ncbi:MAG: glutamate--tRNA ligase [Fimbriimonadaceae bacterium]|nr:glutamate--tRNA ligase [Fimbriimonadaceae bacterium]
MSVRVRFAPSPTGLLHVGALRDALFKHLLAKNLGGQNLLRIEDTDRTRYNPESEAEFITTLEWVGITFDEGPHLGGPHAPYRQSERKAAGIYATEIAKLLATGHAYKAFDTTQELDEMREFQQLNKLPIGYFGGKWRDASPEDVAAAEAEGRPFVIRQRIPRGTKIVIDDLIRGRIEWDSDTVDDPVLIKADGMPTYHFASMVDDHLMGITHIMRGEEWVSSAPKHAALFDAFGWPRPIFVHCPVIVGSDGKKLSKRHGATRVLDYAAQGFLPVALKNFIALIGWNPGDETEVMDEALLIEKFALSGLQPSPGKFDYEKLRWLNGQHLRRMTPAEVLAALRVYIQTPYHRRYWENLDAEDAATMRRTGPETLAKLDQILTTADRDEPYVLAAIALELERVGTFADFGDALDFFLVDDPAMDPKAAEKSLRAGHVPALFAAVSDGASSETTAEQYHDLVHAWAAEHGFEKIGPVVSPLRVALSGRTSGPGLFDMMVVLGPERIRRRLARAQVEFPPA